MVAGVSVGKATGYSNVVGPGGLHDNTGLHGDKFVDLCLRAA